MFSVLILFLIAIITVLQSNANSVDNKYKQSGTKCNYTGIETETLTTLSLVKCAMLCATSESCTAFLRGPGEACSLLETCNPRCKLANDSVTGWNHYFVDGKLVT